jgi:hypothetical protein
MTPNSMNQDTRLVAGDLTSDELLAVRACMRVIQNAAFEEAARVSERSTTDYFMCEHRGVQCQETGEIPCHMTSDSETCVCSIKQEHTDTITGAIRSLKDTK